MNEFDQLHRTADEMTRELAAVNDRLERELRNPIIPFGVLPLLNPDLLNPSPVCRKALTKTLNRDVASEDAFEQVPSNRRDGRTTKTTTSITK